MLEEYIIEVERLAPHITGVRDPDALRKLRAEQAELSAELAAGRMADAYTELADVAWYATKCAINDLMSIPHAMATIRDAERRCGVGETYALIAMRTKYELRAGRVKDKDRERQAILAEFGAMAEIW